MTRPRSIDVADWIRSETGEHLKLLTRLRDKLAATIDDDTTEKGTPSRDWCRAYQRYQTGYLGVLNESREQVKLRLLAKKMGEEPALTDEEFDAELRGLAAESLATLPEDEIHRELERRVLTSRAEKEMAAARREDDREEEN